MAVTIFQNYNGTGYHGIFPSPAYAYDMGNYDMGTVGATWAYNISALYTTTPLNVFDEPNFEGDAVYLPAGFFDLERLESLGVSNDSIASFVAVTDYDAGG
jgi:hypothetical protein